MRVFLGYDISVGPDYFAGDHAASCEHRLIFSNHVTDATRLTIILDATTMAEQECTLGELRAWLAECAARPAAETPPNMPDTPDTTEPRAYPAYPQVPDIPSAPDAPEGQELI